MITDLPVMRREVIARAFRPAGTTSVDSAMKTLRAHKHVTPGVPVALRAEAGGRLAGHVAFYCSLNYDAALMARAGHGDNAVDLAATASAIEQSADFRTVMSYLREHGRAKDLTRQLATAGQGDLQLRKALKRVVARIERARQRLVVKDERDLVVAGRVLSLVGATAELRSDSGERFALPAAQLLDWDLEIGSALVVRSMSLDLGGALWQVLPGIDLDDTTAAFHNPYTDEPRELSVDEHHALQALLKDAPTIPAMAPIPIFRP